MDDLETLLHPIGGKISDPAQRDPKSKTFAEEMGIAKHERQTFPMEPRQTDSAQLSEDDLIDRLVRQLTNKATHSFAMSTGRDRMVKVTVSACVIEEVLPFIPGVARAFGDDTATLFEYEVREPLPNRTTAVVRTGFALAFPDGKVILVESSSPVGGRKAASCET